MRVLLSLLVLLLTVACGPTVPSSESCEACLSSGGTWQPEVEECTTNCDIQDISCFVDSCPEACAPDACGNCFDETSCTEASCTWNQEGEAFWCTE